MSDTPESGRIRSLPSRRGVRPAWIVLGIVVLLLAAVAWVGVRGYLAARDLQASVELVATLKSQVVAGETSKATATAAEFKQKADSARSKTSDAIWRAAEYIPLVGQNLSVVRQVSSIVADVADNGVKPATTALKAIDPSEFALRDGKIDLEPLMQAQPSIDKAASTLSGALRDAKSIDTSHSITAVDDAVAQLTSTLTTVSGQANTAKRVVDLAPGMLGHDGPRNYLMLFENNAELRAGGGIPGAVALLGVNDGVISLESQASGSSFDDLGAPVLKLSTETRGLYGDITGEYMQDVTLTPRFDTSAKLARAMWAKQYGTQVDGVIALDPVTLGYILKVTGPVKLATGDEMNADNAVSLLLSDVYARYPIPAVQDAFFASAAGAVFQKVAAGGYDAKGLITALSKGVEERRVMLWSERTGEQAQLAPTAVAGALPASDTTVSRFGVYLNDATGAKMDYYLDKQVSVGSMQCRADGRATWTVDVTLKNTAPADAATSLPEYVTGGGVFGVQPGTVQTNVIVYAPSAGVFLSAVQDGRTAAPQTALDGKYSVVKLQTRLSPGKTTTVRYQFVGPEGSGKRAVAVEQTPGVKLHPAKFISVGCEN